MNIRDLARDRTTGVTIGGLFSLVIVGATALVMLMLLYRTQSNAATIEAETAQIADSARGINDYTDSIMQLSRTNTLATEIGGSVRPLHGTLATIAGQAGDIAGSVRSIGDSVQSIDPSSRSINASTTRISAQVSEVNDRTARINEQLGGINGNAARILDTSDRILNGVRLISDDLHRTRDVLNRILDQTGDISRLIAVTNHYAGCIDNGLNGGATC